MRLRSTSCAALAAHPHDPTAELLYLRVLVLEQDDATARPLVQRMLAEHPGNFDALYLSGILDVDAQRYTDAIAHLQKAAALNPGHYDVRYQLGLALFRTQ